MTLCVIKNKCKIPIKVHINDKSSKFDYIIYPNTRISTRDLAGSTLSFDTPINITTRRVVGGCFRRIVKKKVENVTSVDIITYVSKITISN